MILSSIIRAANIRYIRIFRFSLAKLLMRFNSKYTKGANKFEDILRFKVVEDSINTLISKKEISIKEATYESYLTIIDKLRERLLAKRFQLKESTTKSIDTKIHNNSEKIIKKKFLIRLRRLA